MKQSFPVIILTLANLFAFGLHVLGLMHIVPLFVSGPILFLTLLVFFIYLNDRKRFKGF